jgi:hypothetical protein
VFAVTLDDQSDSTVHNIRKQVRQPRLKSRVQMNLRLLDSDPIAFVRQEALDDKRQHLGHPEPGVNERTCDRCTIAIHDTGKAAGADGFEI